MVDPLVSCWSEKVLCPFPQYFLWYSSGLRSSRLAIRVCFQGPMLGTTRGSLDRQVVVDTGLLAHYCRQYEQVDGGPKQLQGSPKLFERLLQVSSIVDIHIKADAYLTTFERNLGQLEARTPIDLPSPYTVEPGGQYPGCLQGISSFDRLGKDQRLGGILDSAGSARVNVHDPAGAHRARVLLPIFSRRGIADLRIGLIAVGAVPRDNDPFAPQCLVR